MRILVLGAGVLGSVSASKLWQAGLEVVLLARGPALAAHATELINSGVSIEAVRRRLGHASTATTQLYTLLSDEVADAEIRGARRRDTGR